MSFDNVKTIENDLEYLRQISESVDLNDPELLNDIEVLKEFCKNNEVMAMAAVQLGIPKRLMYLKNTNLDRVIKITNREIDNNDGYDESQVLINPIITKRIGLTKYWEACASCLNNMGLVKRPYIIEIEYYDINGELHKEIFEGFKATVVSHEYDHLNGILHMDIADKLLDLEPEERKKIRIKEPYEILSKDGDYEELKNSKFYNKLVRDNIPEIMIQNGAHPITRILSDDEYIKELNKKLLEEVNEYLESEEVLEIADIEEILLAILDYKKISKEEFEKIRTDKVKKRGAFKKKYIYKEKQLRLFFNF